MTNYGNRNMKNSLNKFLGPKEEGNRSEQENDNEGYTEYETVTNANPESSTYYEEYNRRDEYYNNAEMHDENTVIARDTTVNGNFSGVGDFVIYGTIVGEVATQGNIQLYGKIEGNVKASSLVVDNGSIFASNVDVAEHLTIINGSVIEANVQANSALINATIKGDVQLTAHATVEKEAQVEGNLETKGISVELGARITGNLNVM